MKLDLIKNINLEDIINTPDGSKIGCFLEVGLSHTNNMIIFLFVLKVELYPGMILMII